MKKLALTTLAAVVAASIVAYAICAMRRLPPPPPPDPLPNALIVFCFHGATPTPESQNIEAYTEELLHETYSPELEQGKIVWRVLDYDDPKNASFKQDFGIAGPCIVLGDARKDRPGIARNLQKKGNELLKDKEEFKAYVRRQIDALD